MNEIVESFKRSLIEDGKSPKTIESYIGDIKAFIEFLGDKGVEFNGNLQRFYVVSYKNFLCLLYTSLLHMSIMNLPELIISMV